MKYRNLAQKSRFLALGLSKRTTKRIFNHGMKVNIPSIFCLLALLGAGHLAAQTRIHGQATHLPKAIWRTVLLEQYLGDDFDMIDSAKLSADGHFAFAKKTYDPGLYRMGFRREGHPIEFMVSNVDSTLEFRFEYEELVARVVKPLISKEKDAFEQFKKLHLQLDNAFTTQWATWQTAAKTQPKSAQATSAWAALDSLLRIGGEVCENLKKNYPGTYTAEVLSGFCWRSAPGEPLVAQSEALHRFVLRNLAWKNPALLRSKYFKDTILKLAAYLAAEAQPFNRFSDEIMRYAPNASSGTATFLFSFALQKAVNERNDDAATYLLNSYNPGCSDDDPFNPQQLVTAMSASAPGNTAKDILLADREGQMRTLSEYYAGRRATLIVFWRTSCQHCKEMMPKLEEMARQYAPDSLGIFAVSIDKRREDWLTFLQSGGTNNSGVLHVWCPKQFLQDLLAYYPVTGTPYMAILDRKGRIMNRLVPIGDMEAMVKKALGK